MALSSGEPSEHLIKPKFISLNRAIVLLTIYTQIILTRVHKNARARRILECLQEQNNKKQPQWPSTERGSE